MMTCSPSKVGQTNGLLTLVQRKLSFRSIDHPDIIFDDVVLPETKTHKHLGLILNSNLSWSSHIDSILNSVAPMAEVLKKLIYQVDKECLQNIYFSFIRPKLVEERSHSTSPRRTYFFHLHIWNPESV